MSNLFEFINENRTTTTQRNEERSKALAHTARVVYRQRLLKTTPPSTSTKPSRPPTHRPAAGWGVKRRPGHPQPMPSLSSKPVRHPGLQYTVLTPNLDPYDAAGLTLTAASRQVINFMSKTWLDAHLLGQPNSPWVKPFLHPIILQASIGYLHDDAFRAAEQLPYFNIFQRASGPNSSWRTSALRCKERVIVAARREREQLEHCGVQDRMIKLMVQLFVGAVCAMEVEEARMHGEALQGLLFRRLEVDGESSIQPILVSYILQHDAQLAQMTGRPTVFDVDFWERLFADKIGSSPVAKFLRSRSDKVLPRLDLSLMSATLRKVVTEFWECLWLWQVKGQPSPNLNGSAIAYHVLMRFVYVSAGLSNYHLKCRQQVFEKCRGTDSPGDVAGNYIEVTLAACLLLYLATFTNNPTINGIEVWPKVHGLLVQLREYFDGLKEALLRSGNSSDTEQWRNPMLYAYWIGATWEQSQTMCVPEVAADWFTQGFVDLARDMGIADWEDVRQVVDGFSDSDFVKPHGRAWVDRALREGLG